MQSLISICSQLRFLCMAMLFMFAGCATTNYSMPTPERLVELNIVEADADLAALDRGRVMAIMDCRECHRQYWPQEYSAKRWPRLADHMGKLSDMQPDEIADLTAYLVAASKTVTAESDQADH